MILMKKCVSVVVPVYNEADGIEKFFALLSKEIMVLSSGYTFEFVFVNDGSRDSSYEKLSALARGRKDFKLVNLSRNFGKEIATSAGIAYATGDATIVMDADGQHPPKLISKFLNEWETGWQVVVGIRSKEEKTSFIKKWSSLLFYKLFNTGSSVKLVPRATDFCLIDKVVRIEFTKLEEQNRITRGLIDWLGFKKTYIEFSAPERIAGTATYSMGKLIKLATDSFISLSKGPLYFSAYAGLVLTPLSFVAGAFVFVEQIVMNDPLGLNFTGSAMLGVLIVFLVGVLLLSQGLLGIYITQLHTQALNRPLFIVDPSTSVGITVKQKQSE